MASSTNSITTGDYTCGPLTMHVPTGNVIYKLVAAMTHSSEGGPHVWAYPRRKDGKLGRPRKVAVRTLKRVEQ